MDRFYSEAIALAQERRLAQLADDNAFLDVQALLRQHGVGVGGGGSQTGARGGGEGRAGGSAGEGVGGGAADNTALARLRGHSRVHLPASYAAQHKAFLDMWTATWQAVEEDEEEDSSSNGSDVDRETVDTVHGVAAAASGRRAARQKSQRRAPATAAPPTAPRDGLSAGRRRKRQRGERHVVDLRDPASVAEELAEELRLLTAWHVMQSARIGPATMTLLRRQRGGGGKEGNTAADGASLSASTRDVLGKSDDEALRALQRSGPDGVALPRRVDRRVLVALTRCPSHTAMRAPPPERLPGRAGRPPVTASSHAVEDRRRTAHAGSGGGGSDGRQRSSGVAAEAAGLAPLVAPAAGLAGCVHGHHLCAVCLRRAQYRCLRCKTALFCSIDCHVVHDATRCLKFIV